MSEPQIKISPFGGVAKIVKYVLLTAVGLVFMVAFFVGWGEWLVPLMTAGVIGLFIILTGNKSPWSIAWIIITFFAVWGVQKLSVFSLSTVDAGMSSDVAMLYGGLIGAVIVGITIMAAISLTSKSGTIRTKR